MFSLAFSPRDSECRPYLVANDLPLDIIEEKAGAHFKLAKYVVDSTGETHHESLRVIINDLSKGMLGTIR